MAGRPRGMTPEQRFWEKVNKTETCWLWTGGLSREYGQFWDGTRQIAAHRWVYITEIGPIAERDIDHLCRNKACVNPMHLETVPHIVNVQRATPFRRPKTHCPQGHPYSGDNLMDWSKPKAPRCRQCEHDRYRRRAAQVSEQRKLERRRRRQSSDLSAV